MINLYNFAFFAALVIIPLQYLLDLVGGIPSTSCLISITVSIMAMLLGSRYNSPYRQLICAFFGASILAIVLIALSRHVGFTNNFCTYRLQLCLLAGYVIVSSLWRSNENLRPIIGFLGSTVFPVLFVATPVDLMEQSIHNLPLIYDPILYRFDSVLKLDWLYILPIAAAHYPLLKNYFTICYSYTLLWSFLCAFSQWTYTPGSRAYFPLCFMTLGLVGFCLYYLAPAIGPYPFFQANFPNSLPKAESINPDFVWSKIAVFRNAMPSLHTATALLIYVALRDSPFWQRAIGRILAICIIASTLALGEHYVVDLIAACPAVLFVRSLCSLNVPIRRGARRNGIVTGAVMMVTWIAFIHDGENIVHMPNFLRALAVLSAITFFFLEQHLDHAERKGDSKALVQTQGFVSCQPPPRAV